MQSKMLIGVVAAVVALAAVAFAVAAMSDDDDSPQVENPPLPTAPSGGDDGGPTVGPGTPIPSEPIVTVTPSDSSPDEPLPEGRYAEEAPIDGLDISVAESFPPQYFLHVQAGLPSGCAQQYKHEVSRDGDVITVTVLNSYPEGNPICTAIYGIYELNIPLGSDFDSGETYTVVVNGQETMFTAQ